MLRTPCSQVLKPSTNPELKMMSDSGSDRSFVQTRTWSKTYQTTLRPCDAMHNLWFRTLSPTVWSRRRRPTGYAGLILDTGLLLLIGFQKLVMGFLVALVTPLRKKVQSFCALGPLHLGSAHLPEGGDFVDSSPIGL